jgi:hypothetical protein
MNAAMIVVQCVGNSHGMLKKLRVAYRTRTVSPPGQGYGFGFILRGEGRLFNYGHGGTSGVDVDVRIFPRLGYVVIGLSNFDAPAAERLVDFFINRMPVD